jgi:SAM-dependent methyltransferase
MSTATEYYNATAAEYDALHGNNEPEHTVALEIGWRLIGAGVKSVLDVGCGTGRGLYWLAQINPALELHGIEPSESMLLVARTKLASADLRIGSGEQLPFSDGSIDVVTAAGIMHHVDDPARVISEMFRVASKAILISDHNNYSFGGTMIQKVRIGLKTLGLLRTVNYFRQGFSHKGYSKEDGWWYPYSLFDNYADIAKRSSQLYLFPTRAAVGSQSNILFSQGHLAIAAFKA